MYIARRISFWGIWYIIYHIISVCIYLSYIADMRSTILQIFLCNKWLADPDTYSDILNFAENIFE